jgi:hypothetical protein
MKTLLAAMLFAVSVSPAFATENQASECPYTLHSEERENTKSSLEDGAKKKESEQGATSV